jgi:hypothetical protein
MANIAKRINTYYAQIVTCYDTALDHAHAAGGLLAQAKRAEKHGDWAGWLADNFDGSSRSAQLYMAIDENWLEIEQKRSTVAILSIRDAVKVIAKSKTPKPKIAISKEELLNPLLGEGSHEIAAGSEQLCPSPSATINVDSEPVDEEGDLEDCEGPRPYVTRCPNCDSPCFDEDGDCVDCHEPRVVQAVREPVHEPPGDEVTDETPKEQEATESAGTFLRDHMVPMVLECKRKFPEATAYLAASILAGLTTDWE